MLIAGAGGFAKELIGVLHQMNLLENLVFFDDVSKEPPKYLYNRFPILTTEEEAEKYFQRVSGDFVLGVGKPENRYFLKTRLERVGGKVMSVISPKSNIAPFEVIIEEGVTIITGVTIDNSVLLGTGALLNTGCIVGHDVSVGRFSEIGPGAVLSGHCKIGAFTSIGSNATILPNIEIGQNVVVAAGAVVTKNVDDNQMVAGVPAKMRNTFSPLNIARNA